MATRSIVCVFLFGVLAAGVAAGDPAPHASLDIYFIDVGRSVGNATLIVSPEGRTMLLDAGPSAPRVLDVLEQIGVKKIDTLVTTHYHADHFGATTELAQQVEIGNFIDHGPSVEFGKDDEWWKKRRAPWFREGMGKEYDKRYRAYVDACPQSRHSVVKAGDVFPMAGFEVKVVCSAGKGLAAPLPGAGQENPACADGDRRSEDDAEDAQSIGVLVSFGRFRFVYLGDLTWNMSRSLFCPRNLIGTVDAYLITHHAQSFPKELGDYYQGLSACPKAEVHGLRPRVAFLSLGALGHRQGTSEAMENVRSSPGLEDVWQTNYIEAGGERNHNSDKRFCANIGGKNERVRFIKLSAQRDGSFTVTNSRTQFAKTYAAKAK